MKISNALRRISYTGSIVMLTVATILPSLFGATAHAFPTGAQVTSRSIKMSDSKTSATPTTYDVKFTSASAYTVKGIIVDFCVGSPIIGDATCVKPTGFSIPASPTVALVSGISGGTWISGASAINTNRTLKLTDATGNAQVAGTTVIEFTVAGITNTSTLGSFYARIITYSANAGDIATYAPGTEGSTDAKDYGGIALSTANQLTITAKVQESLTFCVYLTGANCAGAGAPPLNVPLGDANGVLSSYSTNYLSTASAPKFDIASNAQGGVIVNMKGENLCRVASPCAPANGGNIINSSGASCTADSAVTSVEQFGVRVSVLGTGVTSANYGCAANSHAFNEPNTIGTYGDTIASMAAPSDEVQSTMEFMAKAATTTEAGIYTTNLSFIATGTY